MKPIRYTLLLSAALVLCLALPACKTGPARAKVSGNLTRGGKPLEVNAMTGKLIMKFHPEDTSLGEAQYAVVKPDGSFTVPGPDGNGLRPGKYRITVQQFDPFPQTDKLKGAFGEAKSKITREVSAEGARFDIDLDRL